MLLSSLLGCSTVRLTYGQGPTLAYWWLDGYADISDAQAPRVREALGDWFAWHRATQLPEYVQALAELQALAAHPVTPAQVCGALDAWQQRLARAFDQAVPALAEQLRRMTPAQLDHLERRLADNLKEAAEKALPPDPAERVQATLERSVARAETFYGPLDEPQRRRLAAALLISPFDPERWLAERRLRNAELMRRLRQWQAAHADAATVQAGLRRVAVEVQQSPRADYRAHAQRVRDSQCQLIALLHNGTTPAQRQRAADRLRGWADDLQALSAR